MIAKELRKWIGQGLAIGGILWAGLLLIGCQSPQDAEFIDLGGVNVGKPSEFLHVGDTLSITFAGEMAPAPHLETIKDDGTIAPPVLQTNILAAGKTPGELQRELEERYRKYFVGLTVTVKAQERYFYVTGEVKSDGPRPYIGETDIVKAISAAGGLTDFANRRRIRLTRANGHVQEINYQKALDGDPDHNLAVYPGDKIFVRRKFLF